MKQNDLIYNSDKTRNKNDKFDTDKIVGNHIFGNCHHFSKLQYLNEVKHTDCAPFIIGNGDFLLAIMNSK